MSDAGRRGEAVDPAEPVDPGERTAEMSRQRWLARIESPRGTRQHLDVKGGGWPSWRGGREDHVVVFVF